jgi:transposase
MVTKCGTFILRSPAKFWWGSKPPDRCTGFWSYWKSWGSNARSVIRQIRAAEPRKQKHDRRDAALLLKLPVENRFPAIWMPSTELRDLRTLLLHRHQWVRLRTRVQNALQAIALGHGLRRGKTLWSQLGQHTITSLPLAPHAAHRRTELLALYGKLQAQIDELDERVRDPAQQRSGAKLLMTHPGVGPVTALATDVFLGDPARFENGKALVSYVGMIPSEYSSAGRQRLGGLSKQGSPLLRFLWCEAAVHAVRRDPELQRSTCASGHRKDWVKRGSAQLANSGSGCGSCCASRSITKNSVAAAKSGRRAVVPVRGCQKWVLVLRSSDCETD